MRCPFLFVQKGRLTMVEYIEQLTHLNYAYTQAVYQLLKRGWRRMNAMKVIKLMDKYSKCKECGNTSVGNGEGTLSITDSVYKRTCKCGWPIEVTE